MSQVISSDTNKRLFMFFFAIMSAYFLMSLLSDPAFAVTVDQLRAPITGLKQAIFGGWMMAVKICAAAAGIIMSAFKGSLAPFGIGAGLSMGIHLYDQYLGTGADGALI
jgi:hypothetical protein